MGGEIGHVFCALCHVEQFRLFVQQRQGGPLPREIESSEATKGGPIGLLRHVVDFRENGDPLEAASDCLTTRPAQVSRSSWDIPPVINGLGTDGLVTHIATFLGLGQRWRGRKPAEQERRNGGEILLRDAALTLPLRMQATDGDRRWLVADRPGLGIVDGRKAHLLACLVLR